MFSFWNDFYSLTGYFLGRYGAVGDDWFEAERADGITLSFPSREEAIAFLQELEAEEVYNAVG